ncbi:glycosyltransferase family 4 protein [Candidatus Woesebacteria bacterium]|nr:glycosyltransferase family 4 protein [Candidatus Woesebacteria bacterium]
MKSTNIFMIGWEYPPHNSGGLGVACDGLTRALAAQNTNIFFTLPYAHSGSLPHLSLLGCYDPAWQLDGAVVAPPFSAYQVSGEPSITPGELLDSEELRTLPQSELDARVTDYANLVASEEKKVDKKVDVIHAHDWMSFPAALKIRQQSSKPVIAHVHSTEFDRVPHGHGSQFIHQVEYQGLQGAHHVIAVSEYTKQLLVSQYAVDPKKITVVHNGIDPLQKSVEPAQFARSKKVIVFMGRLTMQKGGEFFLQLAHQVLQKIPNALFVIAGNGDMYQELLFKTAYDQLSAHVLFSGFVRDRQRDLLLNRADVFVMPSLSEPFGLVALEAAQRKTPVVVSKQSGVAEVLPSAIQVDFWDVDKMTDEIVRLVQAPEEIQSRVEGQMQDLSNLTWSNSANKVRAIYQKLFQKPLR